MNNRDLRLRLARIEELFAQRGLTEGAPVDISDTLAIIASVRPDMLRLSEIDRRRWYCPDDPRSILSDTEIEEESQIKLRVLEKCALLGFPEGYGQRQYRKDARKLRGIIAKENATDFISLSALERSDRVIIEARRAVLYESGPKYRAHCRIKEIDRDDPIGLRRTVVEWHEVDHLEFLHPSEPLDEEEIASLDYSDRMQAGINANIRKLIEDAKEYFTRPFGTKARLDEWHERKGEDPRLFKSFADWMQFPSNPYVLERQNQQLVAMGFPAEPSPFCHCTKEEYSAKLTASTGEQYGKPAVPR